MRALSPDLKDKYTIERDDTERDAFGQLNAQIRDSNLHNLRAQDRPGYLVLNVGNFIAGGAPNYGQSYLVYKDAVKMRCTYTASDTIQIRRKSPINHLDVVSFGHLSRLFLRMTDQNLRFLCQIVEGQLPAFRVLEFIEAQGWGKLDLRTDAQVLVLSQSDMKAWTTYRKGDSFLPDPIKNTEPGTARTQWIEKLKSDLKDFCGRQKVTLQYIDTSPTTMASLEKRPGAV
ncbi:MAG: DUF3626 domain-containing protein [Pirellulaceae bacterium]|nr:DUF3626 domain-containing protein [Pirellulaceae bacterium]